MITKMEYKFYIIDEKTEIVDASNNMLELRIACLDMNIRIGGNCKVVSKEKLEELTGKRK